MSAFAISEAEVLDEVLAARYRLLAQASVAQYGGRYLVRGAPDAVEGDWLPQRRLIILEFPTMQRLREWYASPDRVSEPMARLLGWIVDR